MVFQIEAQFQQFMHCKFRENIIRLLYIPTLEDGNVFLIVNKYGKVGLYEPEKLTLLFTYLLDLSVPMQPEMSSKLSRIARGIKKYQQQIPKCERTHLVVDAAYASDMKSVVFATTKCILQWYDIGEIETQSIGLENIESFPRMEYKGLKHGVSAVPLRNKGHTETHRLFGLAEIPSCMEYFPSDVTKVIDNNVEIVGKSVSKLIIGDIDGCVTIIAIKDPRSPFGKRKVRGKLHIVKVQDLFQSGVVRIYKPHHDVVKEVRFITPRQFIISCSHDKKYSLFVQDFTQTVSPFIVSLNKGVNTFTHSDSLKIIATGSDDSTIRLFNQFAMKMPLMELYGHKSSVMGVEFINVAASESQILISYSSDVELRAWDPINYVCLQALYISFPIKSTIICKTPEFAKRSLFIYQPNYIKLEPIKSQIDEPSSSSTIPEGLSRRLPKSTNNQHRGQDGSIILLYCNSYAKLYIEKDQTRWPFDFEDFVSEFEEISTTYEKKIKRKQETETKDPRKLILSEVEIAGIESKLDDYVQEIMDIKLRVDSTAAVPFPLHESKKRVISIGTERQAAAKQKDEKLSSSGLLRSNAVYKSLPLYNLQPVELSTKTLPIPDIMKEEMGIDRISCINDLLSQKAQSYFASRSNKILEKGKEECDSPTSISIVSPTPAEPISQPDLNFKFKTSSIQSNSSLTNVEDDRSGSSVLSSKSNDDFGIMNDSEISDISNHNIQEKLSKMVESYKNEMEEELQVPCTSDIVY